MLDTYTDYSKLNPINIIDEELTEQEEIEVYHLELIADRNHNREIINELIEVAKSIDNSYFLNKLLKLRK